MTRKAELRRLEAENASLARELTRTRAQRDQAQAQNRRLAVQLRVQQRPWWRKAGDAVSDHLGDILDRWGIGW